MTTKLKSIIRNITDDPEFQFDFGLTDLTNVEVYDKVMNDNTLLLIALRSTRDDYAHDIELEKGWEDGDPEYLMPIFNEVTELIETLDSIECIRLLLKDTPSLLIPPH